MRLKYYMSLFAVLLLLLTACTDSREEITGDGGQQQIDQQMTDELSSGKYTLVEPLVVLDPYQESPLTAVILFTTEQPVKVRITVEGKDEYTDVSHSFDTFDVSHKIPVYGLYADYLNRVTLTAYDETGVASGSTVEIRTEKLPADISRVAVTAKDQEHMAEGLTFFDCPHLEGNYPLAIDSNGEIRWYLSDKKLNGSVMMTYLKNGNMIVSSGDVIPDTYNNLSSVYEITPLGKLVRVYKVYGVHHDIREKQNGNLIMAASKEGSDSQNDYLVEVDRETGEVVDDWDLREIIPMDEYDTQPPYTGNLANWLHNNGFWYSEQGDYFIISGRHQNMVAKISASDKKLVWVFSGTVVERNRSLQPYLLTPESDDFEYPTSQHSPMILPDGRLMLFDNRNLMEKVEAGEELDQSLLYSRAVIYTIDEEQKTITEEWQYGKERPELYSSFVSDVDYLGEDHYLIDFGGRYVSDENKNYDHVLTPAEIKNASERSSVVVEILNDNVIFEAVLSGNTNSNTYKAERHNIYQNAQELE